MGFVSDELDNGRIIINYGPSHNSFAKLPDGTDVCVFHARTYLEIEGDPLYDPNRHTMLIAVKWDEAGRPVFDYNNML